MNVFAPICLAAQAVLFVVALTAPLVGWAQGSDSQAGAVGDAQMIDDVELLDDADALDDSDANELDSADDVVANAEASAEAGTDTEDLDFQKGDWQVAIGVASFSVPKYSGDNNTESLVVPNLEVRYKDRLNLSFLTGFNYDVLDFGSLSAGPFLDYDFGRDTNSELIGFDEVNASIEVGGFVEYQLDNVTARVKVLQGIGGHEGASLTATLRHAKLYDTGLIPLYFLIGPAFRFGDSEYLNTYYGVTEQQSASSGLSQTSLSSGVISYGLDAVLVVPLSRNIFIRNFFLIEILSNDVARSPIVTNEGDAVQRTLGIELGYVF